MEDSTIIKSISENPQNGWKLLLQKYGARLHGFVRTLYSAARTDDVKDILQEFQINLWKNLRDGKYDERGTFEAYIFGMLRNTCHTYFRRRQEQPAFDDEFWLTLTDDSATDLEFALLRDASIEKLMHCLDANQHQNLHLFKRQYFENESIVDMARAINMADGTLRQQFLTIRNQLRRCFDLQI